MEKRSRVAWFEPLFFLFFGAMHSSRVWAFFDRRAYADAWLGLMYGKGPLYYLLMACMAVLCIMGIVVFALNRGANYWWRWIYLFGGAYILWDLFAIATGLRFWEALLLGMFDTTAAYWLPLWGFFVALGLFSLGIGLRTCRLRCLQRNKGG